MTVRAESSIEDRIVAAYADGLSLRRIATDEGRSMAAVLSVLRRYHVQIRASRQRPAIGVGSVAETRVVASYAQGLSIRRITADERVSFGAVRNALLRNRVPLRPRGGS